ncbi:hypothetical protein NQ314_002529 [Rhamnusium bicolor]|uniref:5'-Nucleotidase C-terminal domain-containing protein n=1 Tax=Rhamnusium bicolor TaxID=1586634 RepID=A0AAV8ZQM2_9CUCU|nr:hypothetical protein NQ314_002529 [Rhamnusium bicolor]
MYVSDITYNDLVIAVPYKNTFDVVEIEGKYIKELLEYNALPYYNKQKYSSLKLMQFSGIHVVLNLTRPEGSRVQSIKIRCQACEIPIYEDLDLSKTYRMVITSYLASGGDGYTILSDNIKNLQTGQVDIDVLVDYLAHRSPLFEEEGGRIIIHGQEEATKHMQT